MRRRPSPGAPRSHRDPSRTAVTSRGVETKTKVKPAAGPLILATDASIAAEHVSSGYIATSGHGGLHAHRYPRHLADPKARTAVGELRAVDCGLRAVLAAHPGQPVEVRVDSMAALHFLRNWHSGGTRMPDGYSTAARAQGGAPTLVKLCHRVQQAAPLLTFVHEKAHVGHPLNEVADSLAKLGLRTLRGDVPRGELPRLVALWTERTLADYRPARAD
ncbi:RNase H family protein [Streptomyces qinglanensis]|uniref:RNase H family protein n=1 Tax=Streptomyces qinglanensis TaxID=943816 RepID=UPI003D747C76